MQPQLLIAVKSCLRDMDLGFHEAVRGTWGKGLTGRALVRFFVGIDDNSRASRQFRSDEIALDVDDSYEGLPHKTREICNYVITKNLSHVFLCDNDTLVNPDGLMAVPYQRFDYGGVFCRENIYERFDYTDAYGAYPQIYPWCSGGMGYFLSKEACFVVGDTFPHVLRWEDMYVGQAVMPEVAKGALKAGSLNVGATEHFKKSGRNPVFTTQMLYDIYNDKDGLKKIYGQI